MRFVYDWLSFTLIAMFLIVQAVTFWASWASVGREAGTDINKKMRHRMVSVSGLALGTFVVIIGEFAIGPAVSRWLE